MQYLLLIYANEKQNQDLPAEQQQARLAEWLEYTDAMKRAGAYEGANALQPVATATSVRVRDGERVVTDGPFAETKEQLGGYYLIEAENLDQALDWAAKCPGARTGTLEVRPVLVFNEDGQPSS